MSTNTKKLKKYLESKSPIQYSEVDKMAEMHLQGELQQVLESQSFSEIIVDFFVEKKQLNLFVQCKYYNMDVDFHFKQNMFDCSVDYYHVNGNKVDVLADERQYDVHFSFSQLVSEVQEKIGTDTRLVKRVKWDTTKVQKKAKRRKIKSYFGLLTLICFVWILIGVNIYNAPPETMVPIWIVMMASLFSSGLLEYDPLWRGPY